MISVSNTVAVNPPGEPVVLTRDDVWHGLTLKAENALPFVPAITECDVLERTDDARRRPADGRREPSGGRSVVRSRRRSLETPPDGAGGRPCSVPRLPPCSSSGGRPGAASTPPALAMLSQA